MFQVESISNKHAQYTNIYPQSISIQGSKKSKAKIIEILIEQWMEPDQNWCSTQIE